MLRTLLSFAALSCSPAATPVPATVPTVAETNGSTGTRSAQDNAAPTSGPAFDHSHGAWTDVLAKFVRPRGFDYAGLKRDRAGLDAYVRQLEAVEPATLASWDEEQRFAFWVNVYNAYTIQLVVDAYPVDSIRDVDSLDDGVWDKQFIPLEGLRPDGKRGSLSLNQVEHEILRKRFEDARLHAAVNCASEGCPPLRAEAFTAEGLDDQLDEQVRAWLADPARNRFDAEKRKLEVSQLFNWFAADFERDAGSVQAWIARYAPPEHADWLRAARAPRLDYLEYSWRLNDASARDR